MLDAVTTSRIALPGVRLNVAEASLALCGRGRIYWLPEATHWVQHDAADAVNEALIAFLRG